MWNYHLSKFTIFSLYCKWKIPTFCFPDYSNDLLLFSKPPTKIQCLKTNFVILSHGSLGRIGLAGQLWVKIYHALLVWRVDWKPSSFSHARACVGVWPEEWGADPVSLSFHVASFGSLPVPLLWAVRLQGQHSTHPRLKLQDLLWAGLGTPIGALMSQLFDQAGH